MKYVYSLETNEYPYNSNQNPTLVLQMYQGPFKS